MHSAIVNINYVITEFWYFVDSDNDIKASGPKLPDEPCLTHAVVEQQEEYVRRVMRTSQKKDASSLKGGYTLGGATAVATPVKERLPPAANKPRTQPSPRPEIQQRETSTGKTGVPKEMTKAFLECVFRACVPVDRLISCAELPGSCEVLVTHVVSGGLMWGMPCDLPELVSSLSGKLPKGLFPFAHFIFSWSWTTYICYHRAPFLHVVSSF